jgi:hypothetical protein
VKEDRSLLAEAAKAKSLEKGVYGWSERVALARKMLGKK